MDIDAKSRDKIHMVQCHKNNYSERDKKTTLHHYEMMVPMEF